MIVRITDLLKVGRKVAGESPFSDAALAQRILPVESTAARSGRYGTRRVPRPRRSTVTNHFDYKRSVREEPSSPAVSDSYKPEGYEGNPERQRENLIKFLNENPLPENTRGLSYDEMERRRSPENLLNAMDSAGGPLPESAGTHLGYGDADKQNIANILSQLTSEDIAKIHRGNVAASQRKYNPNVSEELIDQLTAEGVGSGPATRLGTLADNERAFNEMLQSGSYRELFGEGGLSSVEQLPQRHRQALGAKRQEMLENELTTPNSTYQDFDAIDRLSAHSRLLQGEGYSEAAHTNANLSTATENLTEGASSGGTGMLQPATAQPSNNIMAALEGRGFAGMGASIGMGAVLGGTANYAMGGEFSEGAMMGGLAGGGIAIGARAVAANRESVSGFLQRQVLGDAATTDINANAALVRGMGEEEIGNLGLTGKAARAMLMQNPASPGLQSRHMVIGGSMLAGVAFTGRRNDRRRGFNAHRGNRI